MISFLLTVICDVLHIIISERFDFRCYMNAIDIKLLSISSPTCQALIQEQMALQKKSKFANLIVSSKEILIVRLRGKLIAYGTFDLFEGQIIHINTLFFRDIFQQHMIGQYWLSRYIKRELGHKYYASFMIAS